MSSSHCFSGVRDWCLLQDAVLSHRVLWRVCFLFCFFSPLNRKWQIRQHQLFARLESKTQTGKSEKQAKQMHASFTNSDKTIIHRGIHTKSSKSTLTSASRSHVQKPHTEWTTHSHRHSSMNLGLSEQTLTQDVCSSSAGLYSKESSPISMAHSVKSL